jgi:hypothetical protein
MYYVSAQPGFRRTSHRDTAGKSRAAVAFVHLWQQLPAGGYAVRAAAFLSGLRVSSQRPPRLKAFLPTSLRPG